MSKDIPHKCKKETGVVTLPSYNAEYNRKKIDGTIKGANYNVEVYNL